MNGSTERTQITLRDFLTLLDISHAPVEVRSAFNGKLLCRNARRGNHEDILEREVLAIRPEIRANEETANAIIFCYVDGMPELMATLPKEEKHGWMT